MERIPCSCAGENERCFRCDGRGWYEREARENSIRLAPVPMPPPDLITRVTRKIMILENNPLPPPLPPPERRPKRPTITKVTPPRLGLTKKKTFKRIFLEFGSHNKFPCFYIVGVTRHQQLSELAQEFLGCFHKLNKNFFETHLVTRLRIFSIDKAKVQIRKLSGDVEEYEVGKDCLPILIRIVASDKGVNLLPSRGLPPGQSLTRQGKVSKSHPRGDSRSLQKMKPAHPIEWVGIERNEPSVPISENTSENHRQLDATRDHWKIRDHGQFGSSPSYDDFDE